MMAPRFVWLRAAVSFPLPILAGLGALLLGQAVTVSASPPRCAA